MKILIDESLPDIHYKIQVLVNEWLRANIKLVESTQVRIDARIQSCFPISEQQRLTVRAYGTT